MKTWIVTPVYCDVGSFEILRRHLIEALGPERAREARFVVIDDTAGQDEEIERLHEADDVTVLRPPFNLGHQRAIVYALRKILPQVGDDDAIITLDADGEDQPSDLPRLLAPLQGQPGSPHLKQQVVLALRTKRRESLGFKVFYRLFRLMFRSLTGATVRSGNFAAMPGSLAKRVLLHPSFDLSYSSTILALDVPVDYVPCERGERYEGRSKMTYGRLAMHGLRMLMPFTERIAIRALAVFVVFGILGALLAAAVICLKFFTSSSIPGWTSYIALGSLIVSLVALGNFVSLFVLFSQTRAVSLANIEDLTGED